MQVHGRNPHSLWSRWLPTSTAVRRDKGTPGPGDCCGSARHRSCLRILPFAGSEACRDLAFALALPGPGAAVAQVAHLEEVPWILIRVISDSADKAAVQNFEDFLGDYSKFSWNLIEVILKNISSIQF